MGFSYCHFPIHGWFTSHIFVSMVRLIFLYMTSFIVILSCHFIPYDLFHYTCDVIRCIWLFFLNIFLCYLLCTSTQCFLFTVHIFSVALIVSLCIPLGFMCQNSLFFCFIFYVSVSNDCLLTPWSRVLLEKLTDSQLVKKFPAFYGTETSLPHSHVSAICLYLQRFFLNLFNRVCA